MAKLYSFVVGIVFLVLGAGGFLLPDGLFGFEWGVTQNVVYLVCAALAFASTAGWSRGVAQVFGVIFTGAAIYGFLGGRAFTDHFTIEPIESMLYVAVGIVGLWIGMFNQKKVTKIQETA